MNASEVFGVMASIVALAMLSVAIMYGDKTAKVIGAGGSAFSNSIRAETLR